MSRSYEAAKHHPDYQKSFAEGYSHYPEKIPFGPLGMTWGQIAFRDGWYAHAEEVAEELGDPIPEHW